MVNATTRLLCPWKRDPLLMLYETGWAPGPIWTGAENIAPPGFFYSFSLFYFIRTCSFVVIVLILPLVLYCTTHTTQTSMSPAGFELAIPARYRPQTLALDRLATEIGCIRSPDRPACSELYTEYAIPTRRL